MYGKISNFLAENISKTLYPVMNRLSISRPIERLMRNRISVWRLESAYRDMACDEERENEALDWAEATIGDISGLKTDR